MNPTVDIREFGGEPGDENDCSEAFAKAMAMIREAGGGTLRIPPGLYRSGPIELFDNTTLSLERGACIRFIPDPDLYPPVETRWEGIRCYAMQPLIFARGARNVALIGEGTIDGSGQEWWKTHRAKQASGQAKPETFMEKKLAELNKNSGVQPSGGGGRETQFLRPPLVQFFNCDGVLLRGLSFLNSPFWTIHPVFSRRIRIEAIHIENPDDAPNTDGIDVDSCEDVSISDSVINVGDDCVALKAGSGRQGLEEGRGTRNVSISGCSFLSGHGGVVIGSETAGGIENVHVLNCRFMGTDRGVRLKSRRGRGGLVQNLSFRNLVMDKVLAPITINLYYECGVRAADKAFVFSQSPQPSSQFTPIMRNILVSNLVASNCRASAGFVVGLPESKIRNLVLENCVISIAGESLVPVERSEMYQGLGATDYRGLRLKNVECRLDAVRIENCGGRGVLVEEGCLLAPAGQ
jgi:polygalacturonase